MSFQENLRNFLDTIDEITKSVERTEVILNDVYKAVPFTCWIEFDLDGRPARLGWDSESKRILVEATDWNLSLPFVECNLKIKAAAFPHVSELVKKMTVGIQETVKELNQLLGR